MSAKKTRGQRARSVLPRPQVSEDVPRPADEPFELPPPWQRPDSPPEPLDLAEIFVSADEERLILRRGREDGGAILAGAFLLLLAAGWGVLRALRPSDFDETGKAILPVLFLAAFGLPCIAYEWVGWGQSPITFDRERRQMTWYDTEGFWRLTRRLRAVDWETVTAEQCELRRPDAAPIYELRLRRSDHGHSKNEPLIRTQNYRYRPREAWKAIRLYMADGVAVTRDWTFEWPVESPACQRLHHALRWMLPTAESKAYRRRLRHAIASGGSVITFLGSVFIILWFVFLPFALGELGLFEGAWTAAHILAVLRFLARYTAVTTAIALILPITISVTFDFSRAWVRRRRDRRARLEDAASAMSS